jgi:hypothetical protein
LKASPQGKALFADRSFSRAKIANEIATPDLPDGAPSSIDNAPKTHSVDFPVSASESLPPTPPSLPWQF